MIIKALLTLTMVIHCCGDAPAEFDNVECFTQAICGARDAYSPDLIPIYPFPECHVGSPTAETVMMSKLERRFNKSIAQFIRDIEKNTATKCSACNSEATPAAVDDYITPLPAEQSVRECFAPVLCTTETSSMMHWMRVGPYPTCKEGSTRMEEIFNQSKVRAAKELRKFLFEKCNFRSTTALGNAIDQLGNASLKMIKQDFKFCLAPVACSVEGEVNENWLKLFSREDCKSKKMTFFGELPEDVFADHLEQALQAVQCFAEEPGDEICELAPKSSTAALPGIDTSALTSQPMPTLSTRSPTAETSAGPIDFTTPPVEIPHSTSTVRATTTTAAHATPTTITTARATPATMTTARGTPTTITTARATPHTTTTLRSESTSPPVEILQSTSTARTTKTTTQPPTGSTITTRCEVMTTDPDCHVYCDGKCYKFIYTSQTPTLTIVTDLCADIGFQLGNIYDGDHYSKIEEYLRSKNTDIRSGVYWTGMTFDPENKQVFLRSGLNVTGMNISWYNSSYPLSEEDNTHLTIKVKYFGTRFKQAGMANSIPTKPLHGVFCESG